jgi:hypothetical protein
MAQTQIAKSHEGAPQNYPTGDTMEAIFDIDGLTVAWLDDDLVRDLDGYAVAFIRGSAVYDYNGTQFGFFVNGYFQDREGGAVAVIRSAHGKPLLPEIKQSPIQPDPHDPPLHPVPDAPSTPPTPTLFWSDMDWDDFTD